MDSKRKKKNYMMIFIMLSFIFFAALFTSQNTGYYGYGQYKKVLKTNEAISKFENEIKQNKIVEKDTYLDDKYKDYSNNVSKIGLKTSTYIEKIFTDGIKDVFTFLSKLVLSE